MSKRKITQVTTTEKYSEDGELKAQEHQISSFSYEPEPEYIKLYLNDIGKLKELTPSANGVLLELVRSMSYNNVIPVYMPIKKMISKKLDISVHTVEKSIKVLKSKGLLISAARGIYIADPAIFGKGRWADIKQLRLVVDYNEDGTKQISSNISEQLKLNLGI